MIELTFDKDLIGPWVFRRVAKVWGPEGREAVGLVGEDGIPVAGIVFEDYTGQGGSVSLHISIDNPNIPIRNLLVTAASYCFDQMGVNKVVGLIPSNNVDALRFDMRLGFKPEAVLKDIYPDGDLVILTMYKHECRFYRPVKSAA